MNLPSLDGYFCYAALMIPQAKANQLNAFWSALDARLRKEYFQATHFRIEGEFKSTYLKKLSPEVRLDICRRIAYFLTKNTAFIGGFFTTVHALLCWEVRNDAGSRNFTPIPPYDVKELERKRTSLNGEKRKGFGESHILQGLFHTIAAIPLNWLGTIGAQYSICYDSRDKNEDRILLGRVQEFFPRMKNVDPKLEDVYQGGVGHTDSQQVPGLMLVDLIAKEMRDFFRDFPQLLTDKSVFQLITPGSIEGQVIPQFIGDRVFKWGSSKEIDGATLDLLQRSFNGSPFALLVPRLADEKLSCYAHHGESRVIDFGGRSFNDMVD